MMKSTRLALCILVALLLAGCAGAAEPVITSEPTQTAQPSRTPQPTAEPTPEPTPVPDELVWFAPNMGSVDYVELFTNADSWQAARGQIDVFKFYMQNVSPVPCDICGDNFLGTFLEVDTFHKLQEWGVGLAIEVPAVKEWGCTSGDTFPGVNQAILDIRANGGEVSFLAMDEPRLGGEIQIGGNTCNYEMEEIAAQTASFIKLVRAAHPNIVLGDIEPYPHYSIEELQAWILELEANDVSLPFFHLDVDLTRAQVEGRDLRGDLQAMQTFCEARGIRFGVILTSLTAQSNQAYYQRSLDWAQRVADAVGRPQHLIFQSWIGPAASGDHEVPVNLPQNAPGGFSHTRLITDGLAIFTD